MLCEKRMNNEMAGSAGRLLLALLLAGGVLGALGDSAKLLNLTAGVSQLYTSQ